MYIVYYIVIIYCVLVTMYTLNTWAGNVAWTNWRTALSGVGDAIPFWDPRFSGAWPDALRKATGTSVALLSCKKVISRQSDRDP